MKEEHLESGSVREPLLKRAARHLDMLALAAALVVFGLQVGGVLLAPQARANRAAAELDRAKAEVKRQEGERQFEVNAVTTAWRERIVALEQAHKPVAAPAPSPWRTHPPVIVERVQAGQGNTIEILAATDLRGASEGEAVRLSWNEHPESNVNMGNWIVLRATGDGPFAEVGRTTGPEPSYLDAGLLPGVSYSYRVVGVPKNEVVRARRPQGPPSAPFTIRTESDREILLLDVDAGASTAKIRIRRRQGTEWAESTVTVPVGGSIGEPEPASGVDFRTGYTLDRVSEAIDERRQPRAEIVFGPDAKVLMKDGQPVTEEVVDVRRFRVLLAELSGPGLPPEKLRAELPAEKE